MNDARQSIFLKQYPEGIFRQEDRVTGLQVRTTLNGTGVYVDFSLATRLCTIAELPAGTLAVEFRGN